MLNLGITGTMVEEGGRMNPAPRQEPRPAVNVEEDDSFESLQARLLSGAAQRIHADVEEAKRRGLSDGQGRRIAGDLPEEMRAGAERDFGG